MTERLRVLAPAIVVLVVSVISLVEALRIDAPAVAGLAIVGGLAGLVLLSESRRRVRLRADLLRWLERVSSVTGEPPGRVADRAVSLYRTGLGDDDTAP